MIDDQQHYGLWISTVYGLRLLGRIIQQLRKQPKRLRSVEENRRRAWAERRSARHGREGSLPTAAAIHNKRVLPCRHLDPGGRVSVLNPGGDSFPVGTHPCIDSEKLRLGQTFLRAMLCPEPVLANAHACFHEK